MKDRPDVYRKPLVAFATLEGVFICEMIHEAAVAMGASGLKTISSKRAEAGEAVKRPKSALPGNVPEGGAATPTEARRDAFGRTGPDKLASLSE